MKRILRYLNAIASHGLLLQPASPTTFSIKAFCYADWGADLEDKCFISSYCVFFGPNLVSWSSKKQHTVSRLIAEAEYRALANIAAEVQWI